MVSINTNQLTSPLVTVYHGIPKSQQISDSGQKATPCPLPRVVNIRHIFQAPRFSFMIVPAIHRHTQIMQKSRTLIAGHDRLPLKLCGSLKILKAQIVLWIYAAMTNKLKPSTTAPACILCVCVCMCVCTCVCMHMSNKSRDIHTH
jgi:hypothetical protein